MNVFVFKFKSRISPSGGSELTEVCEDLQDDVKSHDRTSRPRHRPCLHRHLRRVPERVHLYLSPFRPPRLHRGPATVNKI